MPAQMIRLVLLDGQTTGLRSIQLAGRTTQMLACPMSTRSDIYSRKEGVRPAVYILTGADPGGVERSAIYIGECDSFTERFRGKHHALQRAEWAEVFVATTSDGVLNKAHTLYAEDYLRQLASAAGLANDLTERSTSPTLDEGDKAFATAFADDIVLLSKVLGLDVFSPRIRRMVTNVESSAVLSLPARHAEMSVTGEDINTVLPIFEYRAKGAYGRMQPSGSEFYLLAGSTLTKDESPTIPTNAARLRSEGLKTGQLIKLSDALFEVKKDIPLSSVSLAAAIVSGNSTRGPQSWVLPDTNETYAQWDERRNAALPMTRDFKDSCDDIGK